MEREREKERKEREEVGVGRVFDGSTIGLSAFQLRSPCFKK
jgi:hypothetical protein